MIRAALEQLAREGVPFATRGEQPLDDPPPGGDIDILVGIGDRAAAAAALGRAGFHPFAAPGNRRHRFFLAFDAEAGRWLKLDVTLVPRRLRWDLSARDDQSLRRYASYRVGLKAKPSRLERTWIKLARRRPLDVRRRGPVVAVVGPDGAGKGSVIAALRAELPVQVTALYFGHGEQSRAQYGRPARRSPDAPPSLAWRVAQAVVLRLPTGWADTQRGVRRALRASVRAWRASVFAWRGNVVLCDRHALEALAITSQRRSPGRAVERWLLRRLVPWPDRLILLEAPGETLYARKGEHSPEVLDGWRLAYRDALGSRATVIDTTQPLERSVADASALVWQAMAERRGW